ncbi:hypothetical protein IGI04_041298 [Brassica rapa subsp. trilocularis]|uniref:glutathione transferase n=1 Tax=Brassica rapa subsp. trilocularis TaxID=1813537 RepID=A0ABQ7KQE1_BRACM|nr:hypothetical protein IGI04_041298 [Brassica rapa subsp. trilocularis]
MMEKRKVVMCGVLSLLGLLSAVTAFAAEATRIKKSQVKVTTLDGFTRCSYNRSPAYNLGFASAIFLMMAQIIASVGSGCFCCRKGPAPTRSKFTFVLAFLVLLTGASLNDEHIQETKTADHYLCYIVKPGVFFIGSIISLFTVGLGIVYYLCLNSVKQNVAAATTTPANHGIAMGQAQIPERVEDPVFVLEDTYMRRHNRMVVKLYGQVTAACPQRVLLCLLEKEIEFEIIHIDLDTLEQKRPEHLLRQPFGQVPAIEDGDFKLFESRAIARYYATKYADQGTNLLGKSLEHRAIVDQWADVEVGYFNVLVHPLVMNLVIKPRLGEECDAVLVEELKVKLGVVLDIYENQLASNRFLAGDEFTMADLTHMPAMGYLMRTNINRIVKDRVNMNRWWEEVTARPAWKKLMKMAGF